MTKVVAFAGNPNVGKSTLFNAITGMKQHTGNWPGKTVEYAVGRCEMKEEEFHMVDLPGCYSLYAQSEEEAVARDYICMKKVDMVVVVCDATCLERNLNLVLQVLEAAPKVLVCVNLIDEAQKKGIHVELEQLSNELKVPAVGVVARNKIGVPQLLDEIYQMCKGDVVERTNLIYPDLIELGILQMEAQLFSVTNEFQNLRWLSIRLLEGNGYVFEVLDEQNLLTQEHIDEIFANLKNILQELKLRGYPIQRIQTSVIEEIYGEANRITNEVVTYERSDYDKTDRKLDRVFTSKFTGIPIMFALLLLVFWVTIVGANYPSAWLATLLGNGQELLVEFSVMIGVPTFIYEPLIYGVYSVTSWVIAVMLPPMAIFFPLFTLLEDFGYLPRVAFNVDKCFSKCQACGKQALTMCMGFGCNAVGVTGCRIIDSKRERLIAIITNNFVPCNGRFPTIIAIITMFLMGQSSGYESVLSALFLSVVILFGIGMTFLVSLVLSKTVLQGESSSFTLELPPYRKPQVGKVLVRSLFDRTLFVLGRAITVAAPMGLCIWIMANIQVGELSLLAHGAELLEPLGRLMGLDGVILLGFILGFPANEIVMPIILMVYLAQGNLVELENITEMKEVLVANGWTWVTALNMILFSLMHWPCGTTMLTIKKETDSVKWTVLSFALPTIMGILICMITAYIFL